MCSSENVFVAWPKHGSPGLAYSLWCWFRISRHWAITLSWMADAVLSSWDTNVLNILHSSLQHVTSREGKAQQSQSFLSLGKSSMVFTQIFSSVLSSLFIFFLIITQGLKGKTLYNEQVPLDSQIVRNNVIWLENVRVAWKTQSEVTERS